MPRLSTFLGREMRHSGWWPDFCLRLFRKDAACFSPDPVHESVKTEFDVARLSGHIEHHPVRELADLLRKMESYSTLGAQSLVERGKRVGPLSPALHGVAAFLRTYAVKLGFLDGREGCREGCPVCVLPIGRIAPAGGEMAAFFWSLKPDEAPAVMARGLAAWKDGVLSLWPACAPLLDRKLDRIIETLGGQ